MTAPGGGVFEAVVGQERAVAHLRAAAADPVHAYLLEGPPGSGKRTAALAFAAAVLCDEGGCGVCASCRRVAASRHPDLWVVEPEGSFLMVKQAAEIIARAALSPAHGKRNVLVLDEFHRVHPQAAPKLLKILEEPPPSTVFVVLAERRALWRSIPGRLDGTGAAVVLAVTDVVAALDAASATLEGRQGEERRALDQQAAEYGERGAGRKELADRHRRELRRARTDELRFGLATLAAAYRDEVAISHPEEFVAAADVAQKAAEALVRNPNEALLLESVFLRLPPRAGAPPP